MPVSKYFKGRGREVLAKMRARYGDKKGERVFYATANKQGQKPPVSSHPKRRLASHRARNKRRRRRRHS